MRPFSFSGTKRTQRTEHTPPQSEKIDIYPFCVNKYRTFQKRIKLFLASKVMAPDFIIAFIQTFECTIGIHPANDAAAVDVQVHFWDGSQRLENIVIFAECAFLDLQPILFLILVINKHQVVGARQMDNRAINRLGHVKIIGLVAQNKTVNILSADFSTGTVTIESL